MSEIATKVISVALTGLLMLSALAVTAMPSAVSADGGDVPQLPTSFYGNVTVYGVPALVDTVVTGKIVDAVGSPGNGSITVTEAGKYGAAEGGNPKLDVTTNNVYDRGKTIEFYVQLPSWGEAVKANETAIYDSDCYLLDLTVVTTYNLTMLVVGNGTVTPGNGTYTSGDMTINATADSGWQFANWTTDDMSEIASPTSAETTLTLDKNKTVTATFIIIPTYNLTMAVVGNGTVTPGNGTYLGGDMTINATADYGWQFANWSTGDMAEIASATSPETTLTLDKDKTVTATFTPITTTYNLTMLVVGNGTVTPGNGTYPEGDMTINATADSGWQFANWSTGDMAEIASATSPETTLTLDKNKTVTATFTPLPTYNLTMVVVGNGTVIPGNGTYPQGNMTINATADSGWQFANWSTGDMAEIASATSAQTTLTLDKDKTVTATFTQTGNFTSTLSAGWNLVSTPILLDANNTSLGKIFDAQSQLNISVSYSWDGTNWVLLTGDYELLPLYAIYVRVSSGGSATATFVPSQEISGPPTRQLQGGLSLIGPAPAYDFPAEPLDQALASIEEAPGGLKGYTTVVSPGLNQPAWSYNLGGEIKDLLPYKGYWVFMVNGATLCGSSTTPIP